MTVGGPQIISDAIRLCGGENVFGHLNKMAPTVSVEAVLEANPEAIIATGMGDSRPEWLETGTSKRTQLLAVRRNNLFHINRHHAAPHARILDGTEKLCNARHGPRPTAHEVPAGWRMPNPERGALSGAPGKSARTAHRQPVRPVGRQRGVALAFGCSSNGRQAGEQAFDLENPCPAPCGSRLRPASCAARTSDWRRIAARRATSSHGVQPGTPVGQPGIAGGAVDEQVAQRASVLPVFGSTAAGSCDRARKNCVKSGDAAATGRRFRR